MHRSTGNDSVDAAARKPLDEGGLLTVPEAAEFMRMSESWLYASTIPYVRLGRSRRYKRSDLVDAIERNHSTRMGAAE